MKIICDNFSVREEFHTKDRLYKSTNYSINKVMPKLSLIKGTKCKLYDCEIEYNEEEINKENFKYYLITTVNKKQLTGFFGKIDADIVKYYEKIDTCKFKIRYNNYLQIDRCYNNYNININNSINYK